jgi:hypothetical protein
MTGDLFVHSVPKVPAMRCTLLVILFFLAPVPEAEVLLVNKAKDIRVYSDRDEPIRAFFERTRLMTGGLGKDQVTKVIEAKQPLERFFLSYASYNDDPEKGSLFGAFIKLTPPSREVAKLLTEQRPDGQKKLNLTLILRRDDKDPELFTVIGCTDRTPVGFFDDEKKNEADGFAQKELRFQKK